MWQRFTERARTAVFRAQEEAQKLGEGYVSTEHLLLGLLRIPESVACNVLRELEVDLGEAESRVVNALADGLRQRSKDMTLTPQAKYVIDLAYEEARSLGNDYIVTEHLLLGLIRQGDGLAGKVLAGLGVDLEHARRAVIDLQSRKSEPRDRQDSTRETGAIVIPARMASTRFPGKPLCDLLGKPMIQWVWERAKAAGVTDEVLVATPDQEIIGACKAFGADAMLTRADHPSGTDRIEEVAGRLTAGLYINVQGDEPLIRPEDIRALAEPMLQNPSYLVGSLYTECPADEEANPAVVKLVMDRRRRAMYFSRQAIPYARNDRQEPVFKHLGLYGYRRSALEQFVLKGPTPLELAESLEQLRFLEMGIPIQMFKGQGSEVAVDTPEQADAVRELLRRQEPPA